MHLRSTIDVFLLFGNNSRAQYHYKSCCCPQPLVKKQMFLPILTPSKKVFSQLYCTLSLSKWVVDVPRGHVHNFLSLSIVVGTHPVPPDSPDALWNNEMYGQIFTFELFMTNRSHNLLLTLYKYLKKVKGQYKRYLS